MAALSGKAARIRITSAAATSSTNNAATLSTDGVTLTIDSTAKRHWDRTLSTGLAVFQGAGDVTADLDATQTNYVQGIVSFSTPHSTAATYTIDVDAFTSSFLAFGRNWSADVTVDMGDVTTFSTTTGDPQWRSVQPNLSGAAVSIERLWGSSTSPAFFDRLNTEAALVVELVTDQSLTDKLEGYAYVSGDSFDVPVDGQESENVELMIDGQLYRSTA
jgi:hypothetical protein